MVRRAISKEKTAYHEAGHAVMAWLLGRETEEATIIPNNARGTLGHIKNVEMRTFFPDLLSATDYSLIGELLTVSLELLGPQPDADGIQFLVDNLRQNTALYDQRVMAEREALILLAGGVAQSAFLGHRSREGTGGDRDQFWQLMESVVGDWREGQAFLRWLTIRAENILTNKRHWPAVEAVALALLAKDHLTGEEVAAIAREAFRTAAAA